MSHRVPAAWKRTGIVLMTRGAEALRALATGRLVVKSDGIPYLFERLPRRKVWNAIRTELAACAKPSRPWGWPTHLMIEPSTCCNLRCALCPITMGFERPQGLMDPALFRRILDEAGPYAFTLLLWDWGEPFVNPHIYEMIAYAKTKGVKVISSTNGHLFAQHDRADALVRSGLDTIIFAIDGATQATYERYRQGGSLETALDGVRRVVEARRRLGSATPIVNFRFIVMDHNEDDIPAVRTLARDLGVDVLTFKTLNHCLREPYRDTATAAASVGDAFSPRQSAYRRFKTGADGQRIRRSRNPCKQLWNNPSIHWSGTVCPCTFDPQDMHVLGNLAEQGFWDVWRGEPYRRIRRAFRRDWGSMALCGECSYAYEGGSLASETIAEAVFFPSFTMTPTRAGDAAA
jgi:MoaA/NifB/PqqE/SkfB family radical SAM enzyme